MHTRNPKSVDVGRQTRRFANNRWQQVLLAALLSVAGLSVLQMYPAYLTNRAWLDFLYAATGRADLHLHQAALQLMSTAAALPTQTGRSRQALDWLQQTAEIASVRAHNGDVIDRVAEARAQMASGHPPSAAELADLETLANAERQPEAFVILLQATRAQGNATAAQEWQQRIANYTPRHMLATPLAEHGWQLEGYDLYPTTLHPEQRPHVVLFWRAPQKGTTHLDFTQGHYQVADRVIQVLDVPNGVVNGDFEWSMPSNEGTLPYPWRLIPAPSNPAAANDNFFQLEQGPAGGSVLSLSGVVSETLLYTPQELEVGEPYLLLADMQTSGNAILAVMQEVAGVNKWPAVIRQQPGQGWQSVAALLETFNSSPAQLYWGLEAGNTRERQLSLDNLLLLRLQPPWIDQEIGKQ